MKKYTLVLMFSLFAFSLLGLFNLNSASAANCAPGDLFNSENGQPCGSATTSVVICPKGDLFSVATGQRCTAWTEGSSFSDLKIGSRGELVRAFQQMLKDNGFLSGRVDGIFGRITDGAAKKYWEKENGNTCPEGTVPVGMTQSIPPHVICGSANTTPTPTPTASTLTNNLIVTPDNTTIKIGATTTFQARYNTCPVGAMCFVGPLPVAATWTSSNTSVATVAYSQTCPMGMYCMDVARDNLTALVSGVSAGTAIITATYTNSAGNVVTSSALVTVVGSSDIIPTPTPPMPTPTPTPTPSPTPTSVSDGTACLGGAVGCVKIFSLSPVSGPVGTSVTITGSGFTATGNHIKFGGLGMENNSHAVFNSNGTSITFNVPTSNYFSCWDSQPACMIAAMTVAPGKYDVSVINANGTSLPVSFTVSN